MRKPKHDEANVKTKRNDSFRAPSNNLFLDSKRRGSNKHNYGKNGSSISDHINDNDQSTNHRLGHSSLQQPTRCNNSQQQAASSTAVTTIATEQH